VFERSSESDTESTVSTIGEEADRHIEAPFAAEYNGLLGRLVRALRLWNAFIQADKQALRGLIANAVVQISRLMLNRSSYCVAQMATAVDFGASDLALSPSSFRVHNDVQKHECPISMFQESWGPDIRLCVVQLRNAQVQHAVLGALQTDPEFSYLADAAGAVRCLVTPCYGVRNPWKSVFESSCVSAQNRRVHLQARDGAALHPRTGATTLLWSGCRAKSCLMTLAAGVVLSF